MLRFYVVFSAVVGNGIQLNALSYLAHYLSIIRLIIMQTEEDISWLILLIYIMYSDKYFCLEINKKCILLQAVKKSVLSNLNSYISKNIITSVTYLIKFLQIWIYYFLILLKIYIWIFLHCLNQKTTLYYVFWKIK